MTVKIDGYFRIGCTDSIYVEAPLDYADPVVPVPIASLTSAEARLYDEARHALVESRVESGNDIPVCSGAAYFQDGDAVEIRLEDNQVHSTTVSAVTSSQITLADAVPSPVRQGALVQAPLDTEIDVSTPYGVSPTLTSDDWGYTGQKPHGFKGMYIGQRIRLEVLLILTDGGNYLDVGTFEVKER